MSFQRDPVLTPRFIAVGCNRDPNALDWNQDVNLIAYGAQNMVVIYNPHDDVTAAIATLRGSTRDITSVRWIPSTELGPRDWSNAAEAMCVGEIVSGSGDGDLRIWNIQSTNVLSEVGLLPTSSKLPFSLAEGHPHVNARCTALLRSKHQGAITAVHALRWNTLTLIAACSADGPVDIWARRDAKQGQPETKDAPPIIEAEASVPSDSWIHVQTLNYPRYSLMHSVAMSVYHFGSDATVKASQTSTDSMLLLALGGVDTKIRLLAAKQPSSLDATSTSAVDSLHFVELASLEGHLDWIRGLAFCDTRHGAFTQDAASSLLLASAAQDNHVRLTRISLPDDVTLAGMVEFLGEPELTNSTQTFGQSLKVGSSLMEKGLFFVCGSGPDHLVRVAPEAALLGHEEWVCSVAWHPLVKRSEGGYWQPLSLLSSSADKTMMLWKPDTSLGSELWLSDVRVGESGGHTLGLFGACFGPSGTSIVGLGYTGCFHLWAAVSNTADTTSEHKAADSTSATAEMELEQFKLYQAAQQAAASPTGTSSTSSAALSLPTRRWIPKHAPSGHNAPVTDITLRLDEESPYVLSCSADQTARVYAPFLAPIIHGSPGAIGTNTNLKSSKLPALPAPILRATWAEIARPQVHGWNLVAVAMNPLRAHCYASCAEEKLIRVLDAPLPFVASLDALTGAHKQPPGVCRSYASVLAAEQKSDKVEILPETSDVGSTHTKLTRDQRVIQLFEQNFDQRSLSANRPELGLSNKSVEEGDEVFAATSLFPKCEVDLGHVAATLHHGIKQSFVTRPPTEDELLSHSLWPESDKLYGHGYDLVAVGSTSGHLPYLVSAANARSAKNSALRVWDWRTLLQVQLLPGHQQTVVQIAFAPVSSKYCDKLFATVSKDQQVGLWRYVGPDIDPRTMQTQGAESSATATRDETLFVLDDMQKAHNRQAFAVCWSPSGDHIITTSRDKSIKVWSVTQNAEGKTQLSLVASVEKLISAITAIESAPKPTLEGKDEPTTDFLCVCGCEDGTIRLFNFVQNQLSVAGELNPAHAHSGSITRIQIAPLSASSGVYMVFTASEDHSVRALSLEL